MSSSNLYSGHKKTPNIKFLKMIKKIRKLLHPHGFFAVLWPYRYSCIFFTHCNSVSKIWRGVYGTFIVSVYLTCCYLMCYKIYKSLTQKPGFYAQFYMAHFAFWSQPIIIMVHTSMWTFVGHACYTEIVSSSTLVDRELMRICSKHVDLNMMVMRQLVCLTLSVSLPTTRAVLHIFGQSDAINWWNVIQISFIYYPETVTNVVASFFGNLIYLTGDRYALINSALARIGKRNRNKVGVANSDETTLTRQLRVVHQRLFFISRNITQAFAAQTVACVLPAFVNTVHDLYLVYTIQASTCGQWNFHKIFYSIIGAFGDFGVFIYVAYCCHRTVREANGTTKILNSLITNSEDLHMEISSFSYQLMHCHLHFSPLGFFHLDLALLQSIAGSMATYLVILIQMESFDCTKNGTVSNFK